MNTLTIVEPDDRFDFSKINIGALSRISGETYYARIYLNNAPLLIQTPKSLTKQGFVKTGKKMYSDLLFTNQDEKWINWVEHLESRCQQLIYEKKNEWFTGDDSMELHDIEGAFTSMLKLYKSGKFYLIRANVKNNVKIFDENSNSPAKMTCEDINSSTNMVTVIEIQGIKFASKNFQIELEIKQCMVVSPDPFSENCFIKRTTVAKPPNLMVEQIVEEFIREQTSAPKIVQEPLETMKPVVVLPSLSEEEETKRNTELNSITTSTVPVKKLPPNRGGDNEDEDEDEDCELTEIHIGDEVPVDELLGIIDIETDSGATLEQGLKEVELKVDNNSLETISLKRPNQVYYDIYKEARKKAKLMKKQAVQAYLEAKNIKKTYMIEDSDSDSDSDGDSDGGRGGGRVNNSVKHFTGEGEDEGSVDSESDFDDLSIIESDGE
jgi:hypothetical protein